MTTPRFRIFPKRETVSETVSATVSITHYYPVTPEQELAKWQEVLELLEATPNPSPQEALARETVGKRIRELRKRSREARKPE